MNPISAEIHEHKEIAGGIFRLKLRPYAPVGSIDPGRFFMVGVGGGNDPLLRRPLSHLRNSTLADGAEIVEFLYEVRGKGTGMLSELGPPRTVSFIGPLGRGWRLDPLPERVIMVAGGLGVVPLFASALALGSSPPEVEFIYGARTAKGLVLLDELEAMSSRIFICTEDGCNGVKGYATRGLNRALEGGVPENTLILACGPRAMLKKVYEIAEERKIPCQVSMEARMACGMGACLTCSIKGAGHGNLQVCRRGPVFDAKEVDWEALDESA